MARVFGKLKPDFGLGFLLSASLAGLPVSVTSAGLPKLSDANGERFDPKTGELLDVPAAKEPDAAELFERAMADEFAEPEKESETMREQEIERDEPDLGDDFEMEM